MDTIGGRIKALRISKQLNQSELARRVGIKQPSLYNIETDKTKSIKGYVLDAIAKELNTTTSYILDGSTDAHNHEASMMLSEIQATFRKLSPEDQESLLRTARGMLLTAKHDASTLNPFPKVPQLAN